MRRVIRRRSRATSQKPPCYQIQRRGEDFCRGHGEGERYENAEGPATLGTTEGTGLLLRTWSNRYRRWVDIDPGEQAARDGAALPVPEWAARLVCSKCG